MLSNFRKWFYIRNFVCFLLAVAFAQTKLATRKDVIQDFKANYDQNLNDFMSMIDNTEVQNALEAYYSALKSKKKG